MRLRNLASRQRTTFLPIAPSSSSSGESSSSHGVSSYGASTSEPEQESPLQIATSKPKQESRLQIGTSQPAQESPMQIGTSQPAQESPLQIGTSQPAKESPFQISTQQKGRGRTMSKKIWTIADPEKRIRLELDKYNQPVGETAAQLSSSCGVVARMSTLCPITYNDWRKLVKDMKEHIISYMKERFILVNDIEEAVALRTIGHSWSTHKTRLRKIIYKAYEEGESEAEIQGNVPYGVEVPQWIQFVNYWLTEEAIEKSKKHKEIREKQKHLHTSGRKSYARKRKEMEDARNREIGAVEFYRETHMKKNGQMDDVARGVLEKCNVLLSGKVPQDDGDSLSSSERIHLEDEVMLEVLGPEHPGRVLGVVRGPTPSTFASGREEVRLEVLGPEHPSRVLGTGRGPTPSTFSRGREEAMHPSRVGGSGRGPTPSTCSRGREEVMLEVLGPERPSRVRGAGWGPTPSTWSDSKTASEEAPILETRIESLTKQKAELEKRDAEREAEFNRQKLMLEVQILEAKIESLTKRNTELEQREVEREKREAERDVEFNRLKDMLENFMRR